MCYTAEGAVRWRGRHACGSPASDHDGAGTQDGLMTHRLADAEVEAGLRLVGLAAVVGPPKAGAVGTLADRRAAGITPVLITGDHPATASAIAGRVGLLTEADPGEVVTGRALAAGEVPDVTDVRVFAQTDPKQKLDIVQAWRARGHVTAM
nr:HAD family hydrolase [Streptomyces apocyni]